VINIVICGEGAFSPLMRGAEAINMLIGTEPIFPIYLLRKVYEKRLKDSLQN